MSLNDRIKEARLQNGMTQEQLADKIGVAKSTLTGYEKGNREPNIPTLRKLWMYCRSMQIIYIKMKWRAYLNLLSLWRNES